MNKPTRKVTMSVYREQADSSDSGVQSLRENTPQGIHQAVYLLSGAAQIASARYAAGDGFYVQGGTDEQIVFDDRTELLRFVFSCAEVAVDGLAGMSKPHAADSVDQTLVLQQAFVTSEVSAILRLDRVDFPPGAIAYRHTHPGGGLRYLTMGSLTLDATGETHAYNAGEAWFEDADSPVLATADSSQSSQFIRMMLLPQRFEGKSTFTYMNESDSKKPRLQTNTRFFDQAVDLAV